MFMKVHQIANRPDAFMFAMVGSCFKQWEFHKCIRLMKAVSRRAKVLIKHAEFASDKGFAKD